MYESGKEGYFNLFRVNSLPFDILFKSTRKVTFRNLRQLEQ